LAAERAGATVRVRLRPRERRVAVAAHLQTLLAQLVSGQADIDGVRVLGAPRERASTVSFLVDGFIPEAVARRLGEQRIAVWDGDNYAYELMRPLRPRPQRQRRAGEDRALHDRRGSRPK
jgi:selenocysteine lyase/cysteine desulfurase